MVYPAGGLNTHPVVAGELNVNCPLCQTQLTADMAHGPMKLHPCGHLMHAHCQGQNEGFQVRSCPLCVQQIDDFFSLSADQASWLYEG